MFYNTFISVPVPQIIIITKQTAHIPKTYKKNDVKCIHFVMLSHAIPVQQALEIVYPVECKCLVIRRKNITLISRYYIIFLKMLILKKCELLYFKQTFLDFESCRQFEAKSLYFAVIDYHDSV